MTASRIWILSIGALIGAALAPSAASAYCCSNKAICKAVCGSACCGKGSTYLAQGAGESPLAAMNKAELTAEIAECKADMDAASDLSRKLQVELNSRKQRRLQQKTPTTPPSDLRRRDQ